MPENSKIPKELLPLSQEEMDELDNFLISDITSDETMTLDILDGYLTAIVSGPVTLSLNDWLPGIWGSSEEHKPRFESMIFLVCLICVLIGVISYFMNKSTMLGFGKAEDAVKSEQSKTADSFLGNDYQSSASSTKTTTPDKPLPLNQAPDIYHYLPKDPAFPEISKAPRIPKACFENKLRGCICYDQYTNIIKDFPEKRCKDIVAGLDQIAFTRDSKLLKD